MNRNAKIMVIGAASLCLAASGGPRLLRRHLKILTAVKDITAQRFTRKNIIIARNPMTVLQEPAIKISNVLKKQHDLLIELMNSIDDTDMI